MDAVVCNEGRLTGPLIALVKVLHRNTQMGGQVLALLNQRDVHHPVVVGVHRGLHPGVHQSLERMGFQIWHGPRQHVAPWAQFQRHAVFDQPSHDLGVVNGLDPVSDAVRPQFIEGDQDVLRRTRHCGLAGVDGDAKSLGFGLLKQRCKRLKIFAV